MFDANSEELFYELVDLSAGERAEKLAVLTRKDEALRASVSRLLRAHDAASGFLAPRHATDHPTRLGKYVVRDVAGRGAAGVVYVAHDPDLDRDVAVKTITPGRLHGRSRDALRKEARVLATVVHPNVAQVYSIEEATGDDGIEHTVLTMELVAGDTLADRLRKGRLSFEQAIDFGRQIAAALEAAHARSIVHRDLKPANIRITPEGWIKVLDFGLAFLVSEATGTPSGGTPGYMSPEQCRGDAVDPRSDIWSLGAVLFECLAGIPALPGEGLAELLDANRRGEVSGELPETIPARIVTVVRDMLEPDPARRAISAAAARQSMEEELLRLRARALTPVGPESRATGATDPPRGNLQVALSSFVGRTALMHALTERLSDRRIVSITGPGGAGKTRTSVEAGTRMRDAFPGGVWFVDLSAVSRDGDVGTAVARTLGVRDASDESDDGATARAIVASFHGERTLLILDNCEHVLSGAARFVAQLGSIPSAPVVLTTSRQPLGLAGEEIVVLPPLELPEVEDEGGATALTEAVELFVDRARSRVPGFAPDETGLSTVAELCRRLDGLPLAIELAASYARALPLDDILRRATARSLSNVLGSDTTRHRSLDDLVDWSYRLLPEKERVLLRRLSIFRGGWTLAVAESVCGGWGDVATWETCDLLARLVERSLIDPGPQDGTHPARYRLLETIRVFAGERVEEEARERRMLETRYVETLIGHVTPRTSEMGPTRSTWVKRVDPEYANMAHALEISLAHGRHDLAFELAEYASYYWVLKGLLREGERWMARLLPLATPEGPPASPASSVSPPSRAQHVRLLSRASLISSLLWNTELARTRAEEALQLAEMEGDPVSLGHAHVAMGLERLKVGDLDASATAYDVAYRYFAESEHWGWAAVPLANRGVVEGTRGNVDAALDYFERYIALSQRMGNRHAEGRMLLNVGALQTASGAPERARGSLERAIVILEAHDDLPGTAQARQNLGEALVALRDADGARSELVRSYTSRRRMGDRVGAGSCVFFLAHLAFIEGRHAVAAEVLGGLLHGRVGVPWDEKTRKKAEELVTRLTEILGKAEADTAIARGGNREMHELYELALGGAASSAGTRLDQ